MSNVHEEGNNGEQSIHDEMMVEDVLADFVISLDSDEERNEDAIQETESMDCQDTHDVTPIKKMVRHETFVSPGGTKYWIPVVDDSVKIGLGYEFRSLDLADTAYMKYAEEAGFDVRQSNKKKNSSGDVQNRYLLCSKQGLPASKDVEQMTRKSNVKRTNCRECIKFRIRKESRTYVVYKFEERHNHTLYSEVDKGMARSKRRLQYTYFRNVYNASSSCIGGAKSYNILAALKGGYEHVNATQVDYQNARIAMGSFVGRKDAQMLVNLLCKRRTVVPDYFFDILVKDGELQAIFWADEISRLNYKEFGDTISFDATYRTNRHAMNFVPFISIDNHKRSVVVGSALINHENIENFKWVLSAFLKAHEKQPTFVTTDQCAAMKQAVPTVFTESKHRLCMWHIMKKLPGKITSDLDANVSFKRRFNKLVWNNHMSPEEFEEEWCCIIDDYESHHNDWLSDMYAIRQSWISAYYRDVPMFGLMRTTSRSESAHAFFRIYASYRNDLVRFLHAFDGAIEKQRNKHRTLEFITRNTFPRCATPLVIERHASEVYTRTLFKEVQKEIKKAAYHCGVVYVGEDGDTRRYKVLHKNMKAVTKFSYHVSHNTATDMMECECNFFPRNGFPCRHMFKILLNYDFVSIPDILICRRWTRGLVPVEIQAARVRYGEVDVEKERLINGLYSKLDLLVSRIRNDKGKMNVLTEMLDNMKAEFEVDDILPSVSDDRAESLRECYGVDAPEEVQVLPPAGIRNKGCGTGKRLVGALEKATKKAKKPMRVCRRCKKMANHDSRNCPTRNNAE